MTWRLAMSGSAGTGKTTLGKRLAEELGLTYIEEGMRARLESGLDLHLLTPDQHRALLYELWEEQRAQEIAATAGFIADRSSLDYAAFWLHYDFHYEAAETQKFMAQMKKEAERYDRILLLPWGVLPLAADGVRSTNPWTQLRYQSIVEGVLRHFSAAGVVLKVPEELDLESRIRAVRQQLSARARD